MNQALQKSLFKLSTLILRTTSESENIFGVPVTGCGVRGLRFGQDVLLFIYMPSDSFNRDGEELLEIDSRCKLSDVLTKAGDLHDGYYKGMEFEFSIQSPEELPDKTDEIGRILNRYYSPEEDISEIKPSYLLKKYVANPEAHLDSRMGFVNGKLYITESIEKLIYGRRRIKTHWDIADLFKQLAFQVKVLTISQYRPDWTYAANVMYQMMLDEIQDAKRDITSSKNVLQEQLNKVSEMLTDIRKNEDRVLELEQEALAMRSESDLQLQTSNRVE